MRKFKLNTVTLEKNLFSLAILFLPTQLGKHFWPDFSLIYSLRIDYLSPVIYFWDFLLIALIGLRIYNFRQGYVKILFNKTALLLLLIFIFTQIISLYGAVNPLSGLVRLKEYFITGFFGVYIASLKFSEYKKPLFQALTVAVIFSCILAIIQFLIGGSLGLWVLGERDFRVDTPLISRFNFYDKIFLRPYATFSHPNLLAGFLVITLPLIASAFSPSAAAFKLLFPLLVSGTVFITFSRPAFVLVSLYIVLSMKKFWKLWVFLAIITAPLTVVRLSSVFTYDSLSVIQRQELTDYAIALFLKHPFFGAGLNNFINILASDAFLIGTSRLLQPVHNIFLLVLSETGIFGFIGFILLFGCAIFSNLKSKTPISLVLNGSILMIIFLGFFDHYFLTLSQGERLLFLIWGLSLSDKA